MDGKMDNADGADKGNHAEEKRDLSFWYATFFGSGLFPVAPGTAGTVASLVLWAPIVLWEVPWWGRLFLAILIFVTGTPAASRCASFLKKDDPKEVVIDEVAGQGFALAWAGPHLILVLAGFLLFRFFDIVKPWPVSWADKKLHGGLGIMLDDVIAGFYAAIVLFLAEPYLLSFWIKLTS
jgi:phosphatidylglycerophosphatase A